LEAHSGKAWEIFLCRPSQWKEDVVKTDRSGICFMLLGDFVARPSTFYRSFLDIQLLIASAPRQT
jgi:hypothetical protein